MGPLVSARQLAHVDELVRDAVAGGRARVVAGGARMAGPSALDGSDLSRGYFYPPTILVSAGGDDGNDVGGSSGEDGNGDGGSTRTGNTTSTDSSTNIGTTTTTTTTTSPTPRIVGTRLWREEAFGPVVVVVGFDSEDEAVALANDSEFGLGAAVWTRDLARAFRVAERIEAGIVWVNTHHRNDPSSPWGGAKPASGVGSENGIDAYHAYTATKSTIINYADPADALATDDWFADAPAAGVRYG